MANGGLGPHEELRDAVVFFKHWLFECALPLWSDRGFDSANGGFHDLIGHDGSVVDAPKRTFVQARQVYVFCEAGRLGWTGPWRELAQSGLDVLDRYCRHPAGGFVHTLGPANKHADTRRDLYDQAFAAFAFAHAARALSRPDLIDDAHAVFDHLDADWRAPAGGYLNGERQDGTILHQNPHMHLLEALNAIVAGSADRGRALGRANDLARFVIGSVYDSERGLIPEFFDMHWNALHSNQDVEPGHQFEWAWLLAQLHDLGGDDYRTEASRLYEFGQQHGIDNDRAVAINIVELDGRLKSGRARLWPQTERLKAALAFAAAGQSDAIAHALQAVTGMKGYLATPLSGAFRDVQDVDGTFDQAPARASSLYHITCAISELSRAYGDEAAQTEASAEAA